MKTGKYDIMFMGGDIHSDWEIDFFHGMEFYVLTMNNYGKLREGSNESVDWMFPQFQAIKETSVSLTMNKTLQFSPIQLDSSILFVSFCQLPDAVLSLGSMPYCQP